MDALHDHERRMFRFMCGEAIYRTNRHGVEICAECEALQDERLERYQYRVNYDVLPQEH